MQPGPGQSWLGAKLKPSKLHTSASFPTQPEAKLQLCCPLLGGLLQKPWFSSRPWASSGRSRTAAGAPAPAAAPAPARHPLLPHPLPSSLSRCRWVVAGTVSANMGSAKVRGLCQQDAACDALQRCAWGRPPVHHLPIGPVHAAGAAPCQCRTKHKPAMNPHMPSAGCTMHVRPSDPLRRAQL